MKISCEKTYAYDNELNCSGSGLDFIDGQFVVNFRTVDCLGQINS